ncbi:MAG: hypothetical protein A2047_04335 [Omnitrophica bacterium GWA2_41_15]|nr:MAG: hypothetical protein A2047_04335 [Omnitrophica bacterium GWA2_41_15]
MSVPSYGDVHNEYVGQKGVDGQGNTDAANEKIGGRGANIGFITPTQHVVVNSVLRKAFGSDRAEEMSERDLGLDPHSETNLILTIREYGIRCYAIENLSADTGGVAGHYGIRNGNVYVDKEENIRTEGNLARHELYELITLLKGYRGITEAGREELVKQLKTKGFAKILQEIHDENPYQLEEGAHSAVPQHMPSTEDAGYRGAALVTDAVVGDIIVNNDADIVLTKNNFFETHADDTKIITLPASVVIDGSVTPEAISQLIDRGKVSVAILVADDAQYQEVRGKFEPALLEALTQAVNLAFVQINNDNILQAVLALFNESQGNLTNCTLTNLNKTIVEALGIQI